MPYSPLLVKPMKEELTSIGFKELLDSGAVDAAMGDIGTGMTFVVINAVSGTAAGIARPGVRIALENGSKRPDRLLTVFAEQDLEATARMRAHFADIPPSEPSFALFKDGELVYFMPRHRIEGSDAQVVASDLGAVFDEFGG
ncbi:BrxA/BrxB family bacilliredoxin [Kitasatospora purpeofusca]|uniref:BrxA/BrxB family bacilliredoxin n=1 Tax=Kitasatospora purpeofusca TaxID=67352 RepID=UPI002A599254|nr:BrxA/BrxB family bacilliredoxin [Kitasatospora purpeofusca]MDY0811068.1 BrxA/BrxB family bacilliredoxin [Kitasatospora purpeofusca]